MEFLQTYETRVTDDTGRFSLTVLTIPARSFGRFEKFSPNPAAIAEVLGGRYIPIYRESIDEALLRVLVTPLVLRTQAGNYDPDLEDRRTFAEHVAEAPIVPFEHSPLGGESLAKIAKAGPAGLGAVVGYLAAGSTPYLLIAVPLGIVLCGASMSFAKWLEKNYNRIWANILQMDNDPQGEPPTPPTIKRRRFSNE
jgi:hypothetical protein